MKVIETEIFSIRDFNRASGEIKDADWRADLGLAVILEEDDQFKILVGYKKCFTLSIPITVEYPVIRWIDKERILLANPRNETGEDNVFVLDIDGRLLSSFNAGDGIMDIEVTEKGWWFSYVDEGIFGEGISREGLVLYSLTGKPLFKYHSCLPDKPFLVSCDAMCSGGDSAVWILPDIDPDIEPVLMHVDGKKNRMNLYPIPKMLIESTALSVREKDAYIFSQFDPEGNLYYWNLGTETL